MLNMPYRLEVPHRLVPVPYLELGQFALCN